MATVTRGTGATANAITIEGQLWQLTHLVNAAEKGLEFQSINTTKSDDFILEGDFTIPGQVIYNPSTGTFSDSASPTYLSTVAFNAGSPTGTIKSTTLGQYFIDVVSYIVQWQNQPAKNPNNLTNCALKFDYNALQYTGTIVLPYSVSMGENGSIIETATEWLVT